jgi:hypothetical protein
VPPHSSVHVVVQAFTPDRFTSVPLQQSDPVGQFPCGLPKHDGWQTPTVGVTDRTLRQTF